MKATDYSLRFYTFFLLSTFDDRYITDSGGAGSLNDDPMIKSLSNDQVNEFHGSMPKASISGSF